MPIRNYGLLTGLVAGFRPQASNPHHLLDVAADSQSYRVAINLGAPTHAASTQSTNKSDLQYQIVPDLLRTGSAAKSLISKIKNDFHVPGERNDPQSAERGLRPWPDRQHEGVSAAIRIRLVRQKDLEFR